MLWQISNGVNNSSFVFNQGLGLVCKGGSGSSDPKFQSVEEASLRIVNIEHLRNCSVGVYDIKASMWQFCSPTVTPSSTSPFILIHACLDSDMTSCRCFLFLTELIFSSSF